MQSRVMPTERRESAAQQRIIDTAYDLFYRQGYLATGVNQLIEEAKVTKATFYSHFPSKEDLLVTYIRERHNRESAMFQEWIKRETTAEGRFLAPLTCLIPWLEATNYRGCTFQNMAAEIVDPKSPAWAEVHGHVNGTRAIFKELAHELKNSDPVKYADMDADLVGESYFLVFQGTMQLASSYRAIWPVEQALATAKGWVNPAGPA